jgi:hypothetical protein
MSDIAQPITTTNLPVLNSDSIRIVLERNLPKMIAKQEAALALIQEIQPIPSNIPQEQQDEMAEDINARLAAAREVFGYVQKLRMEATKPIDELKDQLMEYERPLDTKAQAKSLYNEKRRILEVYQQEKHDRVQREKADAAKKKDQENFKVDLRARILQALSDNVIETVKRADDYARNLFTTLEPDNFDSHAEQFKKSKPKLKPETFNQCFVVPTDMIDKAKQYFQGGDFTAFVQEFQKEETYDKWNSAIQEAVAPIMNEWRARVPDLKIECIARANASAEEKKKLDEERKARDEQEQKTRQEQLDAAVAEQNKKIQEEAGLQKMSNEFVAQAATQGLEDSGKTKLVLKFTDPKQAGKGFLQIVYEVMSHPDFQSGYPMFQKRDAKKKLMQDEKGRPVYIDPVQWWVDFWLNNCNSSVPGTTITEDAKIVIRK